MKMKNLIITVCALIVAGIVFGTIMFFVRRDLKESASKTEDTSEDPAQIAKEIDNIPVEYIFMQVNSDPEKSYVCDGFLFDKYGKRHYFDLTGRDDLPAEEIYAEAVKQSGQYEPEEYIYPGDVPLIYEQISSIDPEITPEITDNDSLAAGKVFYAILSDGVKTYPVAVCATGNKTVNNSDTYAQNLTVYINNLLESRGSDSTFVPVPVNGSDTEASGGENGSDGEADTETESE